jgi:hypothetical protein
MMISWSNEMSWPKFGPKRWKLGAEAVALPESETAAAFLAASGKK